MMYLLGVVVAVPIQANAGSGKATTPSKKLPKYMTDKTVDTINAGLKYLSKTQRPDGSWLNGGSHGSYPVVMTSLAGLAFMAGGSTPKSGKYANICNLSPCGGSL